MTADRSPAGRHVLGFLALAMLLSGIIAAVGYVPTKRIGGPVAVTGMLVGCTISLVASVAGSIPIVLALRGPEQRMPPAVMVMMSTALRFLVVLMLALAAALSGWFERAPLLVWVGISYVLLLVGDTVYTLRLSGTGETSEK